MRRIAIIITACLTACGGDSVRESPSQETSASIPSDASRMSSIAWETLRNQRIYFGHQSVGSNILDGLRELTGDATKPSLPIVRSRELGNVAGPGLIEFTIGENGDPASKSQDFSNVLSHAPANTSAVALFKYCYLDITPGTDVGPLFAAHRDTVRALQARHPGVTFVHVTAPLTADETAPKLLLKRMIGKPTTRDANSRRNEFNALVRKEFAGEPIFDLARVESTRPTGSRTFFTAGSDTVYTLAPELTDDGGHLNAAGRRAAAIELLSVLSGLSGPSNTGSPGAKKGDATK